MSQPGSELACQAARTSGVGQHHHDDGSIRSNASNSSSKRRSRILMKILPFVRETPTPPAADPSRRFGTFPRSRSKHDEPSETLTERFADLKCGSRHRFRRLRSTLRFRRRKVGQSQHPQLRRRSPCRTSHRDEGPAAVTGSAKVPNGRLREIAFAASSPSRVRLLPPKPHRRPSGKRCSKTPRIRLPCRAVSTIALELTRRVGQGRVPHRSRASVACCWSTCLSTRVSKIGRGRAVLKVRMYRLALRGVDKLRWWVARRGGGCRGGLVRQVARCGVSRCSLSCGRHHRRRVPEECQRLRWAVLRLVADRWRTQPRSGRWEGGARPVSCLPLALRQE